MMSREEMEHHVDRMTAWKLGSLVPFLSSLAATALPDAVHPWYLAVALTIVWMVICFGIFFLMQSRGEWHWQMFLEGSRQHLGPNDPLVRLGERL